MTPSEYYRTFFDGEVFHHHEFLTKFAEDFNSEIESVNEYQELRSTINRYHTYFVSIRGLANGRVFISKKLWKAFYAKFVVPFRKNRFPNEQNRIESRRAEKGKKNH